MKHGWLLFLALSFVFTQTVRATRTGDYLDFYQRFIDQHGIREHWILPSELEAETEALRELKHLIPLVQYRVFHEGLSMPEKIAYICAQNLQLQYVTFPLSKDNILALKRSYRQRTRFFTLEFY